MENSSTTGSTGIDSTQPETLKRFNLEKLRLPQDFGMIAGVKSRLTNIPVTRPHKHEFIRVHPELHFETYILEDKQDRTSYLILNDEVRDFYLDELTPKVLYVYMNRHGTLKIWPIKLPDGSGTLDGYSRTALDAAETAKKRWIRLIASKTEGVYIWKEAEEQATQPKWHSICDGSDALSKIIELAFKDQTIEDFDHPIILKNLRGAAK